MFLFHEWEILVPRRVDKNSSLTPLFLQLTDQMMAITGWDGSKVRLRWNEVNRNGLLKRLLKLNFNMAANDKCLEVVLTFFSNMAILNIHASNFRGKRGKPDFVHQHAIFGYGVWLSIIPNGESSIHGSVYPVSLSGQVIIIHNSSTWIEVPLKGFPLWNYHSQNSILRNP